MKFLSSIVPFAVLVMTVSSSPISRRDVNEALIPQFGFQSGLNPTGSGDCDGAVNGTDGKPIKIPCDCPPDRASFVQKLNANVAAGHVTTNPTVLVTFPEDNSKASQLARFNTASDTLQNLNGPGKGCPIVSTTFQAQVAAINAGNPPPPSVVPPSSSSSSPPARSPSPSPSPVLAAAPPPAPSTSGTPTPAQIEALAPQLGFTSGKNPTGTGNCDGAVNGADGKPIEVPCDCPPSQAVFNQHLVADVEAGHAVHNPGVRVSFPLDNSKGSQLARFNAASITLQNLNGPGQGCPIVSTTFQAQVAAINAGNPPPAPLILSSSSSSSSSSPARSPSPSSSSPARSPSPTPVLAAAPSPSPSPSGQPTPAQIEALAPQLGFTSGKNPTGTGNCDGAVNGSDGKPIEVPCDCPPSQAVFNQHLVADVMAGHAVHNPSVKLSFPLDNSKGSQLARFNAASDTLQNLNGPGQGCPIVSTTFQAQVAAINAGKPPPAPLIPSSSSSSSSPARLPSPSPSSSSPARSPSPAPVLAAAPLPAPSTSGTPTPAQIEALAPQLDFTSGKNPTGTGNCDGAVNGADGKPIEVPCSCPPSQAVFNQHLVADVLAGHAVHNPGVKVSFPLDNSKGSQLARFNAASDTLQNLNGPGQGCPIVSTTFQAQVAAINAGKPPPPPLVLSSPPSPSPSPSSLSPARSPTPSPVLAAAPPPAPSTSGQPTPAQIEALAPQLGFTSGKNPTGTGNCDGAVNGANGKPIEVPCSCPPDQATFNAHLVQDVQAGHAVHNPTVKVTYPVDNSLQSQLARVDTALVTLQNLNGPGQGCPAVSTTLSAQQAALLKQL